MLSSDEGERKWSYLRSGIGAGPHFDHDSASTRGIAGSVDSRPGTEKKLNEYKRNVICVAHRCRKASAAANIL